MEQQIRGSIQSAILRQDKSFRYSPSFSYQREMNESLFDDDGWRETCRAVCSVRSKCYSDALVFFLLRQCAQGEFGSEMTTGIENGVCKR